MGNDQRVQAIALNGRARPTDVLRGLASRAAELRLPPPAALCGSWFGSAALLVPSIDLVPGEPPPAGGGAERGSAVGGGWLGYLGYPDEVPGGATTLLPRQVGGWTSCLLRLDNEGGWWWESLADEACPPWAAALVRLEPAEDRQGGAVWTMPDRAAYSSGVAACLAAIAEGEIYQACVCTRFDGSVSDPLGLYARGVSRLDPDRSAYLAGPWGAVASFSPELFLARSGAIVSSSPIKGTLPLAADPALLRASVKDVAENVMIVDLVRNDFGRVAVPGSTRVPELLHVRKAPGVWHLVSTVTARLREGVGDAELLAATFPPASVTGTPKHAARGLITQWEQSSRGLYCGAIGLVSPWAGAEWSVAIRTVEVAPDGRAALGVGGGITIDSTPDAEWQECLDKATPVLGLG